MSELILSAGRTRRAGTMIQLLSTLWVWSARRLLDDIGLDHARGDAESSKPF
jgi:hypothetical protein